MGVVIINSRYRGRSNLNEVPKSVVIFYRAMKTLPLKSLKYGVLKLAATLALIKKTKLGNITINIYTINL